MTPIPDDACAPHTHTFSHSTPHVTPHALPHVSHLARGRPGRPSVERVEAVLCFGEELARGARVRAHPAGVRRLERSDRREEARGAGAVSWRGPVGEEMLLAGFEEERGEGGLLLAQVVLLKPSRQLARRAEEPHPREREREREERGLLEVGGAESKGSKTALIIRIPR